VAHISVPENVPGIIGPMLAHPHTSKPLNDLAHVLLTADTPAFSKADRETVAAYVSFLNDCQFCSESHAAVADVHWNKDGATKQICADPDQANVSDLLKAYMKIARRVQGHARSVTEEDIERARKLGATDKDINDCVLTAAAFCMFNRYVDGLGTYAPPRGSDPYKEIAKRLAVDGYLDAVK
jgi:uncharacterized peroxidase-related enzyme